jgi:hypothetical protein
LWPCQAENKEEEEKNPGEGERTNDPTWKQIIIIIIIIVLITHTHSEWVKEMPLICQSGPTVSVDHLVVVRYFFSR